MSQSGHDIVNVEDEILNLFSGAEILRLTAVGVIIPAILRLSSLAPGDVYSCMLSAVLLTGSAAVFDALGEDGADAGRYITVSAKLMALTFLGELAKLLTSRCFDGIGKITEIRTYECMALLLCGFLVLGQLVEVLSVVANGDFDKGVFLGIVVAGLSYSTRDMMSCLIYGLYESAYPAFHVGDTIVVGTVHAQVLSKGMLSIKCKDNNSDTLRLPFSIFNKSAVLVKSKRSGRQPEEPNIVIRA
jgi:small-conductance mechanosensitive channel